MLFRVFSRPHSLVGRRADRPTPAPCASPVSATLPSADGKGEPALTIDLSNVPSLGDVRIDDDHFHPARKTVRVTLSTSRV